MSSNGHPKSLQKRRIINLRVGRLLGIVTGGARAKRESAKLDETQASSSLDLGEGRQKKTSHSKADMADREGKRRKIQARLRVVDDY